MTKIPQQMPPKNEKTTFTSGNKIASPRLTKESSRVTKTCLLMPYPILEKSEISLFDTSWMITFRQGVRLIGVANIRVAATSSLAITIAVSLYSELGAFLIMKTGGTPWSIERYPKSASMSEGMKTTMTVQVPTIDILLTFVLTSSCWVWAMLVWQVKQTIAYVRLGNTIKLGLKYEISSYSRSFE